MPEEKGVRQFFVQSGTYPAQLFSYVKVCAERSPEAQCIQKSTLTLHDCYRSRARSKEKITNHRNVFKNGTERFIFKGCG